METKPITMAEYARSRGIAKSSVHEAIARGTLVKALKKDSRGRTVIDPVIADDEWIANTTHTKVRKQQPIASGAGLPAEAATFNESRAKREQYQAELARLEYEEKEGLLVNAEAVKKEAFAVARQVRDGMLNIPDRVAAELAAMTDQFEIHRRLTVEIKKALEGALGDADAP